MINDVWHFGVGQPEFNCVGRSEADLSALELVADLKNYNGLAAGCFAERIAEFLNCVGGAHECTTSVPSRLQSPILLGLSSYPSLGPQKTDEQRLLGLL